MKQLSILLLVTFSCAPKAITYFHEETDFRNFQTYRILNTKLDRTNLSKDGRDILDLLEFSIREKMKERGYQESNLSPDLILRYDISTNPNAPSNRNNESSRSVDNRIYLESIILVELSKTRPKKMFWQSSYDLKEQRRELRHEQATEDAISEIFYSFPYRAGQRKADPKLGDWKTGRKEIKARRKKEKKTRKKSSKK